MAVYNNEYAWAKQLGGNDTDYGYDIALDSSGNAYATGSFNGTATFGSTTLTSVGSYDAFIAKLDPTGEVLWAKQLGGSDFDEGYSIALDSSGNAYATGSFNGTATFGSTTLTSAGINDAYVAKLDPTGKVVWAKQLGGSNDDEGTSIALDSSGNAYITGYFNGTATFGSTTLTSAGINDAYVAKLDANGNMVWAKQLGGTDYDYGFSIALDSSGNAYTTGVFSGTANFGSTTLTSAESSDAYIAKLDPTGEVLWAKQLGGTDYNYSNSIALDSSGNAYTTGYFTGTANFGSTTLTSAESSDAYVAKLDANGEVLWAKQLGGRDLDYGDSIALDSSGNAYTTGVFSGTANFGSTTLTSAAIDDAYIAKLDPTGEVLWAKQLRGINDEYGLSIALDSSGNVYTISDFKDTADFDPGAGTSELTSAGSYDIFVSKLGTPEIAVLDGTTDIPDGTTTAINLGTTPYNKPVTKTFTVNNTGSAILNLSNPSLPTGFSIVGTLPASVAVGDTANFQIQLDATAVGNPKGQISFDTNDETENPFNFPISGSVVPEVQITQSTAPSEKNSTNGTFTINLNAAASSNLTLNYSQGGTATLSTDYSLASGTNTTVTGSTITIASGKTSGTVNLVPVDDKIVDDGETADLTLTAGTGYALGAANKATLAIADNELTITPNTTPAETNSVAGTFTLTRNGDISAPLNVNYTLSGTATSTDYSNPSGGTVTFAANSATATITLPTLDDGEEDSNETIIAAIAPTTGYTISGSDKAQLAIADNDSADISFSSSYLTATEGNAATSYNIVLTTLPTATVTIAFATGSQINPISDIKFDSTNWNVPQTVQVIATDDNSVEGSHSAEITYTVTSTDTNYNSLAKSKTVVQITDNDKAEVSITPTSTNAREGGANGSYDIKLNSQPVAQVAIAFATGDQINPISDIKFDSNNWNVPQTVTVIATDDNIEEESNSAQITHTVTSTDTNYNGQAIASVLTQITDNDSDIASITSTNPNATESGTNGSYDIVLKEAPTAPVTIKFATGSQINPISDIKFDSTNWNVPHTVQVIATDDNLAEGSHSAEITHTVTSSDTNYNSQAIAPVTIQITDNDTANVSITPINPYATEEGAKGLYNIVLTSAPTKTVAIAFNTGNQINPIADISFDSTNWNVPQKITVIATDDNIEEGSHLGRITPTITSEDSLYNGQAIAPFTTEITDNDLADVLITPISAKATEDGANGLYNIVLTKTPTAPVKIAFATGSQINPISSITFDSTNWKVPEKITVIATDDNIVEGLHPGTITPTVISEDGNYKNKAIDSFTTQITDNDTGELKISPTAITATEGGANSSYNIVLTSAPTSPVTIKFATGMQIKEISDITFDSNNWNVPQTVQVIATDDNLAEGLHASEIIHTVTSEDKNYNSAIARLAVEITDNDTSGVSIIPNSITAKEGGAPSSYNIVLTSAPTAPVKVKFSTGDQIKPISDITFDSNNWKDPQTVTVIATDDKIAEGLHFGEIAHTVTSEDANYNKTAIASVTTQITDNDTPSVSINPTSLTATEGGANGLYDIVLTSSPTARVTVNFATGSQINAIAPIVFDRTNWNVPQKVEVIATDDNIAEELHSGAIAHTVISSDNNYNGVEVATVTTQITDNDTAGVSINPTSTDATEGGSAGSYDIVLTTAPTDPVSINFATGNQINPISAISFDSSNWNVPQKITVIAKDDKIAEGLHIAEISHEVSSGDGNYNGVEVATVRTQISDNETAGVLISPTSTSAEEGGANGSYNVKLSSEPVAPVTIDFATGSQINAIAPVTFDRINWDVPQGVTFVATDDAIAEGLHLGAIAHKATSEDANYNAIGVEEASVEIKDNDTAGVTRVQPVGSTNVLEGFGMDIYKVALTTQPTADVAIAITPDGQTSADKVNLIFTPNDWNIPQTVTVTAVDDNIAQGLRGSTIKHAATSADANYNNMAIAPLTVNVSDNDNPGEVRNLSKREVIAITDRDDKVTGSTSEDIIHGLAGNDKLLGEAGNDFLYGLLGDDGIGGGDGNDMGFGGDGNDHITGNAGNDVVYGGAGSDRVRGGGGNDQLFGEEGNDHLFGDRGADTLTGGQGKDAFAIALGSGGSTLTEADVITDFTPSQDIIDLIGGLTYNKLNIFAGDNPSDTILQDKGTGEYLAVLKGAIASNLTRSNFV